MAPPGPRLALLPLLPLSPLLPLLSTVSLAAPECNSTRFDFQVGSTGQNWATLVNKNLSRSLNDQHNSQTKLKQCEVHSNMSGVLTYDSFENITEIFHCLLGLIEEEISLDNCSLFFSYENLTAHMECPCGNRNDSVSGSAGNSLPEWLVPVSVQLLLLLLLSCTVWVGLALYFCCTKRDKFTLKLRQWFKRQPQGPRNEQDGTVTNPGLVLWFRRLRHCRNSSEMQRDLKDAENGQCNHEERGSLLRQRISDSSPNSADSVVLELRPQNGHPSTPLPTLVTQEQESLSSIDPVQGECPPAVQSLSDEGGISSGLLAVQESGLCSALQTSQVLRSGASYPFTRPYVTVYN